jgi:hypothetical protein
MSARSIGYDDQLALRELLVGRRIVETRKSTAKAESWSDEMNAVEFVLDDGQVLKAIATDGGCACSNGCWSVENPDVVAPDQIITGVETAEDLDGEWSTHGDGSATLRLFVYAAGIKSEIVRSEGGDNGYYGWGYALLVETPEQDR